VVIAPVPPHPRRLVFLGTPSLAVPPLRALVAQGYDVALVVTRIDKRRGRGSESSPSPVKAAALELGLTVSHALDDVLSVGADLGIVVAYGRIVPVAILEQLPMINVHFSLLPRWRGAAPMERALLAGDGETGVCIMQLEEGLDTGGVFAKERVAIGPRTTGEELRARLVEVGTDLLVRTLDAGLDGPHPQEGEATYAAKLTLAELELRFDRSAAELDRVVRLGGAWTTFRGRRLKVLAAEVVRDLRLAVGELDGAVVGTGDGALRLVTVQPEGRAAMPAPSWLAGARVQPGDVLGA
jgi:methionyl-tRNA formyltransferase